METQTPAVKVKPQDNQPEKPPEEIYIPTPGVVHYCPGIADPLMIEMVADGNGWLELMSNDPHLNTGKMLAPNKENTYYVPPFNLKTFIAAGALRLPSKADRGIPTAQLIHEIKAFIKKWADEPEEWLEPQAHYVLMSWVFDRFTAVPYLRFLGEFGNGKTRMLTIVSALCYRSLTVSGNITGAGLFRTLDLIQGTLAVDEADFKNSADWSDITKVFNGGYTPGSPIIRCNMEGRNFAPEAFNIYGPKIISTRRRFDDAATESRCLTFEVRERKVNARIPFQLTPEFEIDARILRNKLLGWRFDNYTRIKADDSMLRHLPPRTAQIGASLLAVAPNKEPIIKFLASYAENAKENDPKEIVREIIEELNDGVSIKQIAHLVNARLEGLTMEPLKEKTVGSMVTSIIGHPNHRSKIGYVVDKTGKHDKR